MSYEADILEYLFEDALRKNWVLDDGSYIYEQLNEQSAKIDFNTGDVLIGGERVSMKKASTLDDAEQAALSRLKRGVPRFSGRTKDGSAIAVTGPDDALVISIIKRAGRGNKRIEVSTGRLTKRGAELEPEKTGWGGAREGAGAKQGHAGSGGRPVGSTSDAAAQASRKNGKLGGRPKGS